MGALPSWLGVCQESRRLEPPARQVKGPGEEPWQEVGGRGRQGREGTGRGTPPSLSTLQAPEGIGRADAHRGQSVKETQGWQDPCPRVTDRRRANLELRDK